MIYSRQLVSEDAFQGLSAIASHMYGSMFGTERAHSQHARRARGRANNKDACGMHKDSRSSSAFASKRKSFKGGLLLSKPFSSSFRLEKPSRHNFPWICWACSTRPRQLDKRVLLQSKMPMNKPRNGVLEAPGVLSLTSMQNGRNSMLFDTMHCQQKRCCGLPPRHRHMAIRHYSNRAGWHCDQRTST